MAPTIARLAPLAVLPGLAGLFGGCASTPPGAGISGRGTVVSIQETRQASQTASVVGAVGGALVGSFLGGQVGGGFGRTVAATVGGVGGSLAGSAIAGKAGEAMVWVVAIRFDDGFDRSITVEQRPTYRPGDKVRVEQGVIRTAP